MNIMLQCLPKHGACQFEFNRLSKDGGIACHHVKERRSQPKLTAYR